MLQESFDFLSSDVWEAFNVDPEEDVWGGTLHFRNEGETINRAVATRDLFAGDLEVEVGWTNYQIFDEEYQAILEVVLADGEGYDPVTESGYQARLNQMTYGQEIHGETYSWIRLQEGKEGTIYEDVTSPRILSGRFKMTRRQGEVRGYYWLGGTWAPVGNGPEGAVIEVDAPSRIAIQLTHNWTTSSAVEIDYVRIANDGDGDGLYDDEEVLWGTNPSAADTDGDGIEDLLDLAPLDPSAAPMGDFDAFSDRDELFISLSQSELDGRIILVAENRSDLQLDATIFFSSLAHGDRVEVTFEDRWIEAAAGSFKDLFGPWDRHVYLIDANAPPVILAFLSPQVREVIQGSWVVDLEPYGFDFEDDPADLSWSLVETGSGLVQVEIDPDSGEATFIPIGDPGSDEITLRLTDSAGAFTTAPVTVVMVEAPGDDLFQNGGFEKPGPGSTDVDWWNTYVWEGDNDFQLAEGVAFEGETSAQLTGYSAGKIGILSQTIELDPGTYRLSAMIGTRDVHPGLWDRTTALYAEFGDGTNILDNLVEGDNDWLPVQRIYTISSPTTIEVIFFLYGTGHFWVDSVSLQRLETGSIEGPGLTIGQPLAPIDFQPTVSEHDTILCAFCEDDPVFAASAVCQMCASLEEEPSQPPIPDGPALITSFEPDEAQPFILAGGEIVGGDATHGSYAVRVTPDVPYLDSYDSTGLRTDWTGYDYLKIDIYNFDPGPKQIYIELQDDQSYDYWSRVNYYTYVTPGWSTIQIPLQIYVGEKSMLQQRRRLDPANIRRFVVGFFEDPGDFLVDNIRLDIEPPYASDFSRLLKLDFGISTSPIFYGFTPVVSSTTYQDYRGYGFSPGVEILRTEDRQHPDDLFRDWISIGSGGFDVDLPNGLYTVFLMMEDAGYWEYYQHYSSRTVRAEGQVVVHDEMSASDFFSRYYHFEDVEDLPGDDLWSRYVAWRYQPKAFQVMVTDGQLNLRFEGTTYACALSAMIIYPAADALGGGAFIAELQAKRRAQYRVEYKEILSPTPDTPVPDGSGQPNSDAYLLFHRNFMDDVHTNSIPTEVELIQNEGLMLGMARGESEPLTFSIYPRKSMRLVDLTVEVPGLQMDVRTVRYKAVRATWDGGVYQMVPKLLDPFAPLDLDPGVCRRFWITVQAPETFQDFWVRGEVRLTFDDGQTDAIPLDVRVHPFTLDEPDVEIAILGSTPIYPLSDDFPEIDAKALFEVPAVLSSLREHGMTAATGGFAPILQGYSGANPVMDFSRADFFMEAYRAAGFSRELNSYFGFNIAGFDPYRVDQDTASQYGRTFEGFLQDVYGRVESHAADASWLPVTWNLGDEPRGEGIDTAVELASAYSAAVPGVSTSLFYSATDPDGPESALFPLIDYSLLNGHSESSVQAILAAGNRWGLYNTGDRFAFGYYLAKARQHGCSGQYEFALQSVGSDPYYPLDAREDDLCMLYTTSSGELIPVVRFERIKEGVDDYRYIQTLRRLMEANPGTLQAEYAEMFLNAVMDRIDFGDPASIPWSGFEMSRNRVTMAMLILTFTHPGCQPSRTVPAGRSFRAGWLLLPAFVILLVGRVRRMRRPFGAD